MPQVVYRLTDSEPLRDEEDTKLPCPECEGDSRILLLEETATTHRMVNRKCRTCDGAGCVIASVRIAWVRQNRATQTPVSGVRIKGGG